MATTLCLFRERLDLSSGERAERSIAVQRSVLTTAAAAAAAAAAPAAEIFLFLYFLLLSLFLRLSTHTHTHTHIDNKGFDPLYAR